MDFALQPTTVRAVRAAPLDMALRAPFGISRGSLGTAANVLVTVELADGTLGYGEAAPFPAYNGETQSAALGCLVQAANWLPGRDVADWRSIASEFRATCGLACGSALCALETALLDAVTRGSGVPLFRFFGGAGTELETDMTITTGTAGEAAEAALEIRLRGIRLIKAKIGGPGGPDADLDRISAIREASPDSPLILDGNAGMGRAEAARLMRAEIAWCLASAARAMASKGGPRRDARPCRGVWVAGGCGRKREFRRGRPPRCPRRSSPGNQRKAYEGGDIGGA